MVAAGRFETRRRLHDGAQFERVFASNTARCSNRNFTILGLPNELNHARLGLVVGKRVDRRAVGRNRVKRAIRESFRALHLAPYDLVVIAKAPAANLKGKQLQADLKRLWVRFERTE